MLAQLGAWGRTVAEDLLATGRRRPRHCHRRRSRGPCPAWWTSRQGPRVRSSRQGPRSFSASFAWFFELGELACALGETLRDAAVDFAFWLLEGDDDDDGASSYERRRYA